MEGQHSGGLPDLALLLQHSLAGIYVVQDERLAYANPRMAEIFGYALEELLAVPSIMALVADADRHRVAEMMRRRLTGEVETVQYTWQGIRRDGTIVDLESLAHRIELHGQPAVSGMMIDVTERARYERELANREARLRGIIESTRDVVFTCDADGRLTSLNAAGERLDLFGGISGVGQNVIDVVHPDARAFARTLLRDIWQAGREGQWELPLVTPSGAMMIELGLRLVRRGGDAMEIVGVGRDITERKQKEHALRTLTLEDELTGLYNRRGFLTLAERHLTLAMRKKRGVFLLFCDLDGLKQINDTYGHTEGDHAIADAAALLRQTFRSADIIARLGGDEFTVFPLEASNTSAELLITRLTESVQAFNAEERRPYRLTISVGIARFEPGSAWTIHDLLDEADRRLYDAKRTRADADQRRT